MIGLVEKEENIELAPSSPENKVLEAHAAFPRRRLHRRHHHSNRLSKGFSDAESSPKEVDDHRHLLASLEKIQRGLEESRLAAGELKVAP